MPKKKSAPSMLTNTAQLKDLLRADGRFALVQSDVVDGLSQSTLLSKLADGWLDEHDKESTGHHCKTKLSKRLHVYVIRPIHEAGIRYRPGDSFRPTRKRAVELLQLQLVSLNRPKQTPPGNRAFEEVENWARSVLQSGQALLEHLIRERLGQANVTERFRMYIAIDGLEKRFLKTFNQSAYSAVVPLVDAAINQTVLDWLLATKSNPIKPDDTSVRPAAVPELVPEEISDLIRRLNEFQPPRTLMARLGPRKGKNRPRGGANALHPVNLLVAYDGFMMLLARVRAVPIEERLAILRSRLSILANCLGYSETAPERAVLKEALLTDGKAVSCSDGALFLLCQYTGYKKDHLQKSITKARRSPLTRLLVVA